MEQLGKELLVALDVGSTKVAVIVAEINEAGELEIIGFDRKESKGLTEGKVTDIESTVKVINQAVETVERLADCQIKSVWTQISGSHIELKTATGMVTIKDNEVKQADIDRVVEMSKVVNMPQNKDILHTLTQEFIVDRQSGVHSPLGMSGQILEAKVHFILAGINEEQNLLRCIRRSGIEVKALHFQPIASGEAVLSHDEKELGVLLIDIGGGTTDYVLYKNQSLITTGVVPFAGVHITNDIAIGLRIKLIEAEEIKRRYGCTLIDIADQDLTFEISAPNENNGRMENMYSLAEIIEPRVREIFEIVFGQIRAVGADQDIAQVVLTGGSSLLYGIEELSERIFARQTRVGIPIVDSKLSEMVSHPFYASAVGLIYFAQAAKNNFDDQASGGLFKNLREFIARHF